MLPLCSWTTLVKYIIEQSSGENSKLRKFQSKSI